jgi:cytochrome P450
LFSLRNFVRIPNKIRSTIMNPSTSSKAHGGVATTGCPFSGAVAGDAPSFPFRRATPLDPALEYKWFRAERPITRVKLWNGSYAWLITRYDDVRKVLTDSRFSADTDKPGFPGQNPGMNVARQRYRTFVSMDAPEHTLQRRMLTGEFSIKRMEALRPKIQQRVDELIDAMLQKTPPVDLIEELALPLPSLIICEMLGMPYEDHDFFQSRAKIIAANNTTTEQALQATRELCDEYIGDLIRKKNADPQNDLLSRLVVNHMRNGDLTHHQVVSIARQLLVAGHETTANMTALGTLTLLEHPHQVGKLRVEPSLIPSAVEELLRYLDITHAGRRRVALEDVTVAGQVVKAGEGIIAANPSANRDELAFAEPDKFDICRDARHHVAFGYGVHQCLGQPLARVELQTVFHTLIQRVPTLRLAVPFEHLRFKDNMFVYGLHNLPVAW